MWELLSDPPDSNGFEFVVTFPEIYYSYYPTPPELYISTLSSTPVNYEVKAPLVPAVPTVRPLYFYLFVCLLINRYFLSHLKHYCITLAISISMWMGVV